MNAHDTSSDSEVARPRLSVVIPAYNEESRIRASLEALLTFLDQRGSSWEVVVVDDGSRDHTAAIVEELIDGGAKSLRLIRLPRNSGKGAALRVGVMASVGERVLMMDADLSTPLCNLDRLEAVLGAGSRVVVGSRALDSSTIQRSQSPLRVLLGRVGNLWIRTLTVRGVHDTQCGFKLLDGELARRIFSLSRENGFGIDIEILHIASRLMGERIIEVGVSWEHRDGSKVSWHHYLDVFLTVPRIAWEVRRRATKTHA